MSKVPANQGHTIKLSTGTFVENGPIDVPTGVNIEGSGHSTVLKASSSFFFYPTKPGYTIAKYLIRFISPSPTNGAQSIKNLAINGDGKKLHGGVLFQNRDNIRAEGLKLEYINFNGLWLWKSKNSRITNCQFLNCSWGSYEYCSGALMLGDLENVEVDYVKIDEGRGYGMKALHFSSTTNRLKKVKIHDCHVTVNPYGLWQNNRVPNMTIELWNTYLSEIEIYNNYLDNTLSLISEFADQVSKTVRVHHNTFDIAGRSKGTGYSIELSTDYVEIDNNFFNTGTDAIGSWHSYPRKEWNIHHNVFYGLHGTWPSQALRAHCAVTNVKFNHNTYESKGTTTENVLGFYAAGTTRNMEIKNNLFINSNTSISLYPNKLIQLQNGAKIEGLQVTNNLFYKLDVGTVPGSYSSNITGVAPQINASGNRPDPYYRPKAGSPLIDKGVKLGYPYSGLSSDIGAYEYGSTTIVTIPPPSSGTTTITLRARGTSGTESIQLQVNNSTIATWTMTTSMANYTATTSATGDIKVRLVDGSSNRDAQVDYIQVNGTTRQAENQTVNTSVYQNGACGGSNSEWMHCSNGYIGFGNVSTTSSSARLSTDSEDSADVDQLTDIEQALLRFVNPVNDGILRMEFDEELSEVRILDLSGRTMKVYLPNEERKLNEVLGLLPGLYFVQPVKNGERKKPHRLIVE